MPVGRLLIFWLAALLSRAFPPSRPGSRASLGLSPGPATSRSRSPLTRSGSQWAGSRPTPPLWPPLGRWHPSDHTQIGPRRVSNCLLRRAN